MKDIDCLLIDAKVICSSAIETTVEVGLGPRGEVEAGCAEVRV